MKGLIFSITAGQGHNQTAKVLSDYFAERGIECPYMDVYKFINPILSESVSKIYLMSTKSMPKIYGKVYSMCENRNGEEIKGIPKVTNKLLAHNLVKMINAEKPDFIICTHVFAAILVTVIRNNIADNIKTLGIVTDFTVHPYWEDTVLDFYITPNELMTVQGAKRGIPKEKFVPLGIPIDKKYEKKYKREEALKMLGLPDKKTVLVMSGSMGFGKVTDEISALDKAGEFQVIVVCGNNKKLKEKVDKLKTNNKVYSFGYVDNVDVMMDAADCIVTKPGGLTTSEALAKELPMIMNNPVPGQEDRNVEFLLNAGAAVKVSRTFPVDEAVKIAMSEERCEEIKKAVKRLAKPTAAKDLVDFVIGTVE